MAVYHRTRKKKRGSCPVLVGLMIKIVITASVCILVWYFVAEGHRVSGNAMYPALRDGDFCVIEKVSALTTGDAVYYEAPDGTLRFGRVAAVGGQSVEVYEDGGYGVNGYEPVEQVPYPTYRAENGISYPCGVPEGSYFILGDYRDDTSDSRTYGPVSSSSIRGKVCFLLRRRGF